MQRPITRAFLWVLVSYLPALAQAQAYNPDWYIAGQTYVKLSVVEDGIYRVDAADLAGLGLDIATINPAELRLLENGKEIPIWYEGPGGRIEPSDLFLFVGRRNTGADEAWVYGYNDSLRSSSYRSLYTDTTTYFLTWGGAAGLRYARRASDMVTGPLVDRIRVEDRLESDDTYFFGEPADSGNPLYTDGEGFYMGLLSHSQEEVLRYTYNLGLRDLARFDDDSLSVHVQLRGGTRSPHLGFLELLYVDPTSNSLVATAFDSVAWAGYKAASLSANLPQGRVLEPGQNLQIRIGSDNSFRAQPNNILIDYISYSYVRALTVESGQFGFSPEFSGERTFQLSGSSDTDVVVLQPESSSRFDLKGNGTFGDLAASGSTYWLASIEDVGKPRVSLDESSNLAASFNVDYVIISALRLSDSAQQMAEYRSSAEGGQYDVLVVNVRDVFDQFDYGRPTPIAIRRFLDRLRSSNNRPRFITLWGDALYPNAKRPKFNWEVPSFGNASSDGWYAMSPDGDSPEYVEWVPIGRITARSNEAGAAFVDKLRSYESRPLSDWQKRIILMSGGANISEQLSLTSHTVRWGDGIKAAPFGGDVTFFHKSSTAALDPTFLDSVDAAISEGSGWLAFFGHSAADTWEIVTESPTLFENSQRLPIVVSLGCFTGAFARGDGSQFDQPPFAELLVTESENGAIAHYGGSTSSFISVAAQIANPLYDLVFKGGERILGEAIVASKKSYLGDAPNDRRIETVLQYNLIGDPATQMALPSAPDFHVEARSVSSTPRAPVAGIDSTINVVVAVENRGLIPEDSLTTRLVRVAPDGTSSSYQARLPGFALREQASFRLPVSDSEVGENRLQVEVDPDHLIAEGSEDDNFAEITQLIFSSGVVQLYPPDLGLVTSPQPSLQYGKASAGESRLSVVAQLDTVDTFDSDVFIGVDLDALALSSWVPQPGLVDAATYHWRIAVSSDDPLEWRSRSFTVRRDLPFNGWFQQGRQLELNSHGPSLRYSHPSWHLEDFDVDVRIRSAQFKASAPNTIIVGGFEHETLALGFAAVIVAVDGRVRASGWYIPYPNVFGRDESEERDKLRNFLAGAKEDEYVFVNSRFIQIAPGVIEMPDETKAVFRDLGSTQIDSVDLDDLWNFGFRVGDPTPLIDEWQDRDPLSGPHILWSDLSIPIRFASGYSQSPPVGPATEWHEFRMEGVVNNGRSSVTGLVLSLDGDTLGSETLQMPGGMARIDLSPSGLDIDARVHPYLRLGVVITDSTRLDTPQLLDWYVGYDPVSEIVVDAPGFDTAIDTVAEGESLDVSVNVANAGPSLVDTVFVRFTVTDRKNRSSLAAVDTLLGFAPNITAVSTASIGTEGFVGSNAITVKAVQDRGPEPASFNNTVIGSFRVLGDDMAPVFSLTVDGISYPNDPRVINTTDDPTLPFFSSRPTFEIGVSDDNEFLALADTTVISLSLDGVRLAYSRADVQFVPGTTSNNEARLVFSPDFSGEDTTHTLKAWAQDASGNSEPTKEEPYTLSFRVQSAADIESLYPYPNPMHNFTAFMFNLRGADPSLVQDLRIRVYTISGRPVREFDLLDDPALLEEGGLRIGWNRVVWDGRDEDGDLLATGVYLYKVFLRAEDREISVNNDSGIEKIAIIR